MKLLILMMMTLPLIIVTVHANDCEWMRDEDTDLYTLCLEEMLVSDCIDCDKKKEGWDFNEFVGIIAGPLSAFGQTWLTTEAYKYGQDQCTARYDSQLNWLGGSTIVPGAEAGDYTIEETGYLGYSIERGMVPVTLDDLSGALPNPALCNGNSMGSYAGFNGMMGGGYGGTLGFNGSLGAGYSPMFMDGMMGPNYGGMMTMDPGLSMGAMLGMGLLGGGLSGGLYLNGGMNTGMYGGMNTGMYGGMNTGMYGGMNTGMYGGMNGGMYGGMNGGMYGGMNGGMMYPGGGMMGGGMMTPSGGLYVNGGMNGYYNPMNSGMFNASMGIGMNPMYSGTGSYWNTGGGWDNNAAYYQQQQQYYQQQEAEMQAYYQQQQAQYQINMDLSSRAYENQAGNIVADQALYGQYQNAAYDYYNNMYGNYNPYGFGDMNANIGFQFGFGF